MQTWAFLSFAFIGIAMFYMRTPTTTPLRTSFSAHTMLLVMVKNEALVIQRMLSSFKHVGANYLFLCDTGSNDTTVQIAEQVWQKNYKVHRITFVNFETTRNECNLYARLYAQKLRSLGVELDYVLLADADFTLSAPAGGGGGGAKDFPPPEYDLNTIQIYGTPHNSLPMLIKYTTFAHCRYRLWTHEFLDCSTVAPPPGGGNKRGAFPASGGESFGYYNAFHYIDHTDGHSRPEKLTRDISILQDWLVHVNATDLRPRALYYLARAQEDSGAWADALQTYEAHNREQTFTNYLFYAKYRMALITMNQALQRKHSDGGESVAYDDAIVESLFLNAFGEYDGYFRAEPLYWLARYFRQRGMLNKCILYATAALNLPSIDFARMPLFLEMYIYDWATEEELAFCLKHKGRTKESREHYERILQRNHGRLDNVTLERIANS